MVELPVMPIVPLLASMKVYVAESKAPPPWRVNESPGPLVGSPPV